MAKNPGQFEKGLGLHEFLEDYGREEQRRKAFHRLRWRPAAMCVCTAGTIIHGTKLPLRAWYLAIYLLIQRKKNTSAQHLSCELGVKHNTAWRLKHKLMQVMLERVREQSLAYRIEKDDAYLGQERAGKSARRSRNKVTFIAAIETMKVLLRRVTGFWKTGITRYAKARILPDSEVVSDGLHGFSGGSGLRLQACTSDYRQRRHAAQHRVANCVNTLLGNVNNALPGTFHAIRGKHVPRYLVEFEYRFNRRLDLPAMIGLLTFVGLRTPPVPYRPIRMTEA